MRIQLEGIIKQILDIDKNKILKNPSTYCKEVIFHNAKKNFVKPEHTIDIVDFIHELDKQPDLSKKNNFTFIAEEINAETLFKEEQLKKAIEIINITDAKNRIKKIYEYIYNYLKKDFVENRYCDFKKNKCVAQRHFTIYPINRKNGCCFTKIRKCPHLEKGECKVECVACRLYSCPYLTKRGIGYYGNEFILLKAFYTKKQRHNLIFKFYKPKEKVLEKLFSLKTKQIDT